MNLKRVWIVAMVVGGALMGLAYFQYTRRPAKSPDANQAPGAEAAPAPVERQPETASTSTAAPSPAMFPAARAATAPAGGEGAKAEAPGERFTLGSLDPDRGYAFQVEVTPEGAAVESLRLTNYFDTVADKQLAARHARDHAAYEREVSARPDKYGGNYRILAPVESGGAKYRPLATRQIKIWVPESNVPFVGDPSAWPWELLERPTTLPDGTQTLRLAYKPYLVVGSGGPEGSPGREVSLTVVKTYAVRKGDYSLGVSLEVRNESNLPLRVQIEQYGPMGIPPEFGMQGDSRQAVIGKVQSAKPYVLFRPRTRLNETKVNELFPVGYSRELEGRRTLWVGEVNRYFGSIVYPVPADPNDLGWHDPRLQFALASVAESRESQTYVTCVALGVEERNGRRTDSPIQVGPGKAYRADFDVFAGPKKRELLSDEESHPLYARLHYLGTIQFGAPCCGMSFCTFDWLALAMMWLLVFFSKITLNYGIAIILLVILVRVLLFPLTRKGQMMMAKSQKLAPAIEKLKAQYKDDKEALQKEMMKVYRQQGFTPLLGCLPMMLQMPIWIALWSALSAAVELRHAAFLPVWLTDLSAPDALVHLPFVVPLLGWRDLNLLPILGCVSTFIQMKLTPQAAPATSPEQQRQQAMMKYMMPIMMVFFFYTMPSGLNLYIMVSGLLAAGEQYFIRQHIKNREEREAARLTTVEVPGRGPRGSRPKKPKGPYWFKRG